MNEPAALAANAQICDRLAAIEDLDNFVAAVEQVASAAGIAVSSTALAAATRPDPLGLDRFDRTPATQHDWPGRS